MVLFASHAMSLMLSWIMAHDHFVAAKRNYDKKLLQTTDFNGQPESVLNWPSSDEDYDSDTEDHYMLQDAEVKSDYPRMDNQASEKQSNVLNLCKYPKPTRQSFRTVCGDYQQSFFICDPQSGLSHSESHAIDRVLQNNHLASCYCPSTGESSCRSNSANATNFAIAFASNALLRLLPSVDLSKQISNICDDKSFSKPSLDTERRSALRDMNATIALASAYADQIRSAWNSPRVGYCKTDILVLAVESWESTDDRTPIKERSKLTVAISFDKAKLPFLENASRNLLSTTVYRTKLKSVVEELLKNGLKQALPLPKTSENYNYHNYNQFNRGRPRIIIDVRPPPVWAWPTIGVVFAVALLLAFIGNFISRSRLRHSPNGSVPKTSDKSWKAGFSGGVWGSPAAVGTKPRRTGLFVSRRM